MKETLTNKLFSYFAIIHVTHKTIGQLQNMT